MAKKVIKSRDNDASVKYYENIFEINNYKIKL